MSTTTSPTSPAGSAVAPTRTYASYSRPLWRRVLLTREFAVIALTVIVFAYANTSIDNFDGPLTIYQIFRDLIPVLLIALPMTLIVVTGEIDLSVASVMGLSSALVGLLVDGGMGVGSAALVALVVGVVCGAFNGFLVAYVGLPSLAVTIGTLALYRGIAQGLLGTTAVTGFDDKWKDLATDRIFEEETGLPRLLDPNSYPQIMLLFLVLLVLFVWMLHFSSFGRGIYEIGLNDEAAHFTGVNVELTKFWLFVMAGAVSALAGVYYTLRYGSARGDNATGLELQVIAAVLLGGVSIFGGRGAFHGVIAGVVLIGFLSYAMKLQGETVNVINIVIGVLLVLSVISTSLLAWVSARISGRRAARPHGSSTDSAGKRSLNQ